MPILRCARETKHVASHWRVGKESEILWEKKKFLPTFHLKFLNWTSGQGERLKSSRDEQHGVCSIRYIDI